MTEGAGFDLHTTAQHLISYIFDKDSLQYSCLENTRDRGAWQATVHEVARVGHDLKRFSMLTQI